MFTRENDYVRAKRKSVESARSLLKLEAQKQWPFNRSGARGVWLPEREVFAKNENYLELSNPGWNKQWVAGITVSFGVIPFLLVIWCWYCFGVHPLLFNEFILFIPTMRGNYVPDAWPVLLVGWLIIFPLALASAAMIYGMLYPMGWHTCFFTYLRGRIRFNRQTRKVYVLRPANCGGNQVYKWERLLALHDSDGDNPSLEVKPLALYHPPFDPDDPQAKGEDCIYVGSANGSQEAAHLWEYIRQYMEVGPSVDRIPKDAPAHYKGIARYLHPDYFTYCGKPSAAQLRLELGLDLVNTFFHLISQMTCSWPRFPKEWESDSGLGEPEDRPVQTGAVMTALVYRAEGKLSKADEIEFLTHWGTEEALAEAKAR
ncbi:hypothetical protein [Comamonas sp. NoAH]|uniref:hypothetical protein n=1 Tax=Comamonas halotolerans TaxID=3041496 RepID=UPI0024E0CADA|nr:hypothetical protein [Comamonas sp. NoAH]